MSDVKAREDSSNDVAANSAEVGEAPPAQNIFDVELLSAGPNRDAALKAVREITGLDRHEAESLLDSLPTIVKEQVDRADAEEMVRKFAETGATAIMK